MKNGAIHATIRLPNRNICATFIFQLLGFILLLYFDSALVSSPSGIPLRQGHARGQLPQGALRRGPRDVALCACPASRHFFGLRPDEHAGNTVVTIFVRDDVERGSHLLLSSSVIPFSHSVVRFAREKQRPDQITFCVIADFPVDSDTRIMLPCWRMIRGSSGWRLPHHNIANHAMSIP